MKQLRIGVSGTVKKRHEENGITVIDEFDLDGASIIADDPFDAPLTDSERAEVERILDRAYDADRKK